MDLKTLEQVLSPLGVKAVRIIIIFGLLYIFLLIMKVVSRRIVERTRDDDHTTLSEREKRGETLSRLIDITSRAVAAIIGIALILDEFGIDMKPLLAGAGIAGLALSFGAQSIVKDYLSGFFILMENQFRVGDVITLGSHTGTVDLISMRTTILRDVDGILHIIPNGEVKSVMNMTHTWSRVKLDIGVDYDTDIDRAVTVLTGVGEELSEDDQFGRFFLETPRVLAIQDFGESQIVLRIMAKTLPQQQWNLARELRLRIKKAFDKEGIVIPFPQRVVHTRPNLREEKPGGDAQ